MLCCVMLCYAMLCAQCVDQWDIHGTYTACSCSVLLCIHAKAVCRMSPNGDEKTGRAGSQAGPWMEALDLAAEVRRLSSKTYSFIH